MTRIGILASGDGTNFQALHDACSSGYVGAEIALVLCSKAGAGVLRRAERAGVEAVFVDPAGAGSREEYDRQLANWLEKHQVDVICNAGYLRILSADFVRLYENRALNIHPSLLPAFPGLHVIEKAWEWGAKVTGVTVHLVDAEVDHGPIVLQRAVEVLPGDTLTTLTERIHLVEYELYPRSVKLLVEGRLRIEDRRIVITEDVAPPPWAGELPPGLRA